MLLMDPEGLVQIGMTEVYGCSGFRILVPPITVVHTNKASRFIVVDTIVQCSKEVPMEFEWKGSM